MKENYVYIHKSDVFTYPDSGDCFSPSQMYPEYDFKNDISSIKNPIYDIIRNCLYAYGLDKDNFGKSEWNPLKDIIMEGDTVLIKPNLVMHENGIKKNGTDCLITHPSLVRAILDYVIKALNGTGSIIIADAPMQSCDFDKLIEEQGYRKIIEFYKRYNIKVELVDLRNYKSYYKNGVLQINKLDDNESIIIDLKNKSEFNQLDEDRLRNLRITNYNPSSMYDHHRLGKHEYLISKKVLEADVIINMPKPKTHRKAGVTSALKNLIGINTNKQWLPHHTKGSQIKNGDEYLYTSILKQVIAEIYDKIYKSNEQKEFYKVKILKFTNMILNGLGKLFFKDRFQEGSWYGNDTIWRTILDINKIAFYADKNGVIQNKKQRKMLIIGDMIVSGEGEGPLMPSPKNVGIIAIGTNPVCFDEVISTIMGFDYRFIPSINNARKITDELELVDLKLNSIVNSNYSYWNNKLINDIKDKTFYFEPSEGWKGYKSNTNINL